MSKLTILVVKLLLLCVLGAFMSFTFIHFIKDPFLLNISLIMLACGLAIACGLETKQYVKSKSITISSINENLKSISFDIGADQFVDVYAKTALMFMKHCISNDLISLKKLKQIAIDVNALVYSRTYMVDIDKDRTVSVESLNVPLLTHYVHIFVKNYITATLSKDEIMMMLPRWMDQLQATLNNPSVDSEQDPFAKVIYAFNYYCELNQKIHNELPEKIKQLIKSLHEKLGNIQIFEKQTEWNQGLEIESFGFTVESGINENTVSKEQWKHAQLLCKYFEAEIADIYQQI